MYGRLEHRHREPAGRSHRRRSSRPTSASRASAGRCRAAWWSRSRVARGHRGEEDEQDHLRRGTDGEPGEPGEQAGIGRPWPTSTLHAGHERVARFGGSPGRVPAAGSVGDGDPRGGRDRGDPGERGLDSARNPPRSATSASRGSRIVAVPLPSQRVLEFVRDDEGCLEEAALDLGAERRFVGDHAARRTGSDRPCSAPTTSSAAQGRPAGARTPRRARDPPLNSRAIAMMMIVGTTTMANRSPRSRAWRSRFIRAMP